MVLERWLRPGSARSAPLDPRGEELRRDARYRVGRWLGRRWPTDLFGVLLLASVGFPVATWLEWLRGGLGEPLGIEVAMLCAWAGSSLLAYAWWFFARQERAELGGIASEEPGAVVDATKSPG